VAFSMMLAAVMRVADSATMGTDRIRPLTSIVDIIYSSQLSSTIVLDNV